MPALNVAPTRRNYLELSKALRRTQEGHDLLEQKRQILILELMSHLEVARRIKAEVVRAVEAAHEALRKAAVQAGMAALERLSCAVALEYRLAFRSRSVMGVPVPDVQCTLAPMRVQFAITHGLSYADVVIERFRDALGLVAELAEVENAVFRLAREVRRTQRRVNALEKTYIPQYKEALHFIEEALAERQREEFIVLRKVKHKRQAAERVLLDASAQPSAEVQPSTWPPTKPPRSSSPPWSTPTPSSNCSPTASSCRKKWRNTSRNSNSPAASR
jgi:V/A-type H+-transporting ATPase subunit D